MEGFALAVREELQRMSGPQFGEFLEVQLAPDRRPSPHDAQGDDTALERSRDLLERIERTPSALREALTVCRERDAGGAPRLARALIERLLS